jgi:V8-like Glu-specific endopeptidase
MPGLPRELLKRLRQVLLHCEEFQSDRRLQAVFVECGLAPFQNDLPEANTRAERVDLTISYLHEKHLASGENALIVLLRALIERKALDDELHLALVKLVEQLDWLGRIDPASTTFTPEANPEHEPMLAVLEIEQMYRSAQAVAQVDVPRCFAGQQRGSVSGTAWMVAPALAITCAHVLRARSLYETLEDEDFQAQLDNALLTCDFLSPGRGTSYQIARLECQDEALDYAILRLAERTLAPTTQWGYLRLAPADLPLTLQTALFIIQHPLGQPQQGAFGKFSRQEPGSGTIYYQTPTEHGTSGAPVLNRANWQVVALHQGESQAAALRQGRLISTIMSDLKLKNPALYQEIQLAQK